MPCCLGLIAIAFPRFALFIMWVLEYTDVFHTRRWPILGFFFLPYTTCAYAIAMNSVGSITGIGLALIIIGVFLDVGSHGGAAARKRS